MAIKQTNSSSALTSIGIVVIGILSTFSTYMLNDMYKDHKQNRDDVLILKQQRDEQAKFNESTDKAIKNIRDDAVKLDLRLTTIEAIKNKQFYFEARQ